MGVVKDELPGDGTLNGLKVRPVGVAIFSEDGVEIVPITDQQGLLDKIFDRIPELVDKVKQVVDMANEGKAE